MKRKLLFCFLILFFIFSGCTKHQVKTESGQSLSTQFNTIFKVLTTTETFYYQVKSAVKDLNTSGYLDLNDQRTIVSMASTYKAIHNEAAKSLQIWYNQVNEGNEVTVRDIAIQKFYSLSQQGEELALLINNLSDGQIQLPEKLIPNAVELFKIFQQLPT